MGRKLDFLVFLDTFALETNPDSFKGLLGVQWLKLHYKNFGRCLKYKYKLSINPDQIIILLNTTNVHNYVELWGIIRESYFNKIFNEFIIQ